MKESGDHMDDTLMYGFRLGQFQVPDNSLLKLYSSPLMVDVV
jgi:hypothetical protein